MRKTVLIFIFHISIITICNSQDSTYYRNNLSELNNLEYENQYIFYAKGMAYQNLGKYDSSLIFYNKAITLYEESQEIDHEDKDVVTISVQMDSPDFQDGFSSGMIYYYTGVVCHELGKPDSAIINYQKIISTNPQFSDANYQLALVYFDTDQYKLAIAELNSAIKIKPNDRLYLLNRAYAKMKIDENDSALVDITKSISVDPDDPYAFKMLGEVYLAKGDTTKACLNWEKAQVLDLEIEEYKKCDCKKIKN